MTEQDLTDLGFEKVVILDEDSSNGFDYYYYNLEVVEGVSLVSNDSDTVVDNKWHVLNWDWPSVVFNDKEEIRTMIQYFQNHQI